jgi:hypothetical protein
VLTISLQFSIQTQVFDAKAKMGTNYRSLRLRRSTCISERHLLPISSFEYADFFHSRRLSMLIDRLAQLSVRGGHLLLLYSTKKRVETFMYSHLIPVMDRFLREFILLVNLFFQLGTMLRVSTVCLMLCTTSFVDFAL